jgi:hypothetical protein
MKELSSCDVIIQSERRKRRIWYRYRCLRCPETGEWKRNIQEAYSAGWYHDDFIIFARLSGGDGSALTRPDARHEGAASSNVAPESRRRLEEKP